MAGRIDLMSLLDSTKTVEKIKYAGPQIGGRIDAQPDSSSDSEESLDDEADNYAQQFQLQDDIEALERATQENDKKLENPLNDVDSFTTVTCGVDNLSLFALNSQIYKKYHWDYNAQQDLPINAKKEDIIKMINTNQVVIIEGSTGCGKSTQVPQFILDHHRQENKVCNIIVTQPRRIAAISIARRVADQRKWPLGSVVGYQIGLANETSDETILNFVTTGVLLQKLINAQNLNEYTHIILDEVHERDKDMDFLMLVVRKFLRTNSRSVKIILMSATFNVEKFSEYFSVPIYGDLVPAPVIKVFQQNRYQTQVFYLDDLSKLGVLPDIIADNPNIDKFMYRLCGKLIKVMQRLDDSDENPGTVLVFLPGIHEIEEMDTILKSPEFASAEITYDLIPLHSTITTEEQKRIFVRPKANVRKIILSTNIAESSITVPDIKYVIDFCLTKDLIYDSKTSFTCLQLNWAAKSNCVQRAGRAGRVADGRVYRLVNKYFYEEVIPEEKIPDILRCPLDVLVLLTKRMNLSPPPHEILALALDPPRLDQIEKTILILKEIGALLINHKGNWSRFDGDMTFLGHVMAMLPLDTKISKMIVLGHLFSCLEEAIIMAAGMTTKCVFSTPFKEGMNAYNSKLSWADGSCSDLIAILNVYKVWRHHNQENVFTSGKRNKRESIAAWSQRHYLQYRVLDDMHQLITEITSRLKKFNIVQTGFVRWTETEKPLVLKVIICGAFYPNFFIRFPNQVDEREAVKLLGGRSPFNTVYLQGMETNQPGLLYSSSIKEKLSSCGTDLQVSFDKTNKVYIQFLNQKDPKSIQVGSRSYCGTMPGAIPLEVYRAIRRRQLYKNVQIPILPLAEAMKRAKEYDIEKIDDAATSKFGSGLCAPELPGIQVSILTVKVCHVIDPGHFWAQPQSYENEDILREINESLLTNLTPVARPHAGSIYAAPFEDAFYRVRLESFSSDRNGKKMAEVFFIDYGNKDTVSLDSLKMVPKKLLNIPGQAMECVLCCLKPSLLRNSRGQWVDAAYELFNKLTSNCCVAEIYSVTGGVVSVKLFKNPQAQPPRLDQYGRVIQQVVDNTSINQLLLDKGFAQPAEESYLSRHNHEIRQKQLSMEPAERECYNQQQKEYTNFGLVSKYIPSPSESECRRTLSLKGPYSPLEARLYSVNCSNNSRFEVGIDNDSVNSVFLDTEPQDPHQRLMVAASVSTNQSFNKLNLRYTTLMPNLHGFPVLMALMFCYKMELRTNIEGTKYGAVLCGLGQDPNTQKTLLRDHDLLLEFDVDISIEDMNRINSLRYYMNTALYLEDDKPDCDNDNFAECQRKIQANLVELLKVERASLDLGAITFSNKWGHCNEATLLMPSPHSLAPLAIFPLHPCIDLKAEAQHIELQKHSLHLSNVAKRMVKFPDDGMTCEICDITVLSVENLRVHLVSTIHKNNCALLFK